MIESNIPVNPNIQRFEAAYTKQVMHDKVDALRMRIGAGAAVIGSLVCVAVLISLGVLALPVSAILLIAVTVTMYVLPILAVGLALLAANKIQSSSFSFLRKDLAASLPFDDGRWLFFNVKILGRYGIISKETLQEIMDFERRLRAIPGALTREHAPQYDAAYDDLKKEWRNVLIPKIQADLPYPIEDRELAMKAHELYKIL